MIGSVTLLVIFGEKFLYLWTIDKIEISTVVFLFVVLEAATFFIGYTCSVTIVAINKHAKFVVMYLVTASIALLLSWLTIPIIGLVAVPLVFSIGNLLVGCFTILSAMKISNDRLADYLPAVIFLKSDYDKQSK